MMILNNAASRIGSCLMRFLNEQNFHYLVAVDELFSHSNASQFKKYANLEGKSRWFDLSPGQLPEWLNKNKEETEFWFHTVDNPDNNDAHHWQWSWEKCYQHQIPFMLIAPELDPTVEKFCQWAAQQKGQPFFWAILLYRNVYGPNEVHLGHNASVIYKIFEKASKNESFNSEEQSKQVEHLISIHDVTRVIGHFIHHRADSGIYRLHSQQSASLHDLTILVKELINHPISEKDLDSVLPQPVPSSLLKAGYSAPFIHLKQGIHDYLTNFLLTGKYY